MAFPLADDAFDALITGAREARDHDGRGHTAGGRYMLWLPNRKAGLTTWDRFRLWLGRVGWAPLVINTLDRISHEILDLAGDPQREGVWGLAEPGGRGRPVGQDCRDTASTGKAADAGLTIILLTGTLGEPATTDAGAPRRGLCGPRQSQTLQEAQIRTNRAVGVGVIDQRRAAGGFSHRGRGTSAGS